MNTDKKIKISDLKYGYVINTDRGRISRWHFWLRFVTNQIRKYQQRKHGRDAPGVADVHSVFCLDSPNYFEFTFPRAQHGVIAALDPYKTYTVYRYVGVDGAIPEHEREAIEKKIRQTDGKIYDVPQLFDILIKQWFGWIPEGARIFDIGQKNRVCSVLVAAFWVKWWKLFGQKLALPRPLGAQHVEVAAPADFANCVTYKFVGRLVED